jgi:hypothetical protein
MMRFRSVLKSLALSFVLVAFGGLALAADPGQGKSPTTKPAYPLTTCVVSGEKLGEMGKPKVIEYEGREVQFCCPSCEKDFRKDAPKYLKKLDEAAKKPATQPAKKSETDGGAQGGHDHAH